MGEGQTLNPQVEGQLLGGGLEMEQGLTMHVPQVSSLDGMACLASALGEHQLGVSVSEGTPFLSSFRPSDQMGEPWPLPSASLQVLTVSLGRRQGEPNSCGGLRDSARAELAMPLELPG